MPSCRVRPIMKRDVDVPPTVCPSLTPSHRPRPPSPASRRPPPCPLRSRAAERTVRKGTILRLASRYSLRALLDDAGGEQLLQVVALARRAQPRRLLQLLAAAWPAQERPHQLEPPGVAQREQEGCHRLRIQVEQEGQRPLDLPRILGAREVDGPGIQRLSRPRYRQAETCLRSAYTTPDYSCSVCNSSLFRANANLLCRTGTKREILAPVALMVSPPSRRASP